MVSSDGACVRVCVGVKEERKRVKAICKPVFCLLRAFALVSSKRVGEAVGDVAELCARARN